ncbi:MAG: hypothetical protein K5792_08780, partial [Butyrivibrio sp.]|nr:hypothetical protein [Butyrivibrio sp.]
NFTDKNVPQRRVCFKEFQKKNKCHELQNLKDEKKYTVGWLSAGLWSGTPLRESTPYSRPQK